MLNAPAAIPALAIGDHQKNTNSVSASVASSYHLSNPEPTRDTQYEQTSNVPPKPPPQSQHTHLVSSTDTHYTTSKQIHPRIKVRRVSSIAPAPVGTTANSRVSFKADASNNGTNRPKHPVRRTLTADSTYAGSAAANLFTTQAVCASDVSGCRSGNNRAAPYHNKPLQSANGSKSGFVSNGYSPTTSDTRGLPLTAPPSCATGAQIKRCQSVPGISTGEPTQAHMIVADNTRSTPLPVGLQPTIANTPAAPLQANRYQSTDSLRVLSITNKKGRTQITPKISKDVRPMVEAKTPANLHAPQRSQQQHTRQQQSINSNLFPTNKSINQGTPLQLQHTTPQQQGTISAQNQLDIHPGHLSSGVTRSSPATVHSVALAASTVESQTHMQRQTVTASVLQANGPPVQENIHGSSQSRCVKTNAPNGQAQSSQQRSHEQRSTQAHEQTIFSKQEQPHFNQQQQPQQRNQNQSPQQQQQQQQQQVLLQQQSHHQVRTPSSLILSTPDHRPATLRHAKSVASISSCTPAPMKRTGSMGALQGNTPGSGTQRRFNLNVSIVSNSKGRLQKSPAATYTDTPRPKAPAPLPIGAPPPGHQQNQIHSQPQTYPAAELNQIGSIHRAQEGGQALQHIQPRPLAPAVAGIAPESAPRPDTSASVVNGLTAQTARSGGKTGSSKTLPHARCKPQNRRLPQTNSQQGIGRRATVSAPLHSTPVTQSHTAPTGRQPYVRSTSQHPIRTLTSESLSKEPEAVLHEMSRDVGKEIQRLMKLLQNINEVIYKKSHEKYNHPSPNSTDLSQMQQNDGYTQTSVVRQPQPVSHDNQQYQQHQQQNQQQKQRAPQPQKQSRPEMKDPREQQVNIQQNRQQRQQLQQQHQMPQQSQQTHNQQQSLPPQIPHQQAQTTTNEGSKGNTEVRGKGSTSAHEVQETRQMVVGHAVPHAALTHTQPPAEKLSLQSKNPSQGTVASPSSQAFADNSAYPTPRQSQVDLDDVCSPFAFGNIAEDTAIAASSTGTMLIRSLTAPASVTLAKDTAVSRQSSVSTISEPATTTMTDTIQSSVASGESVNSAPVCSETLSPIAAHPHWGVHNLSPFDTTMHVPLDFGTPLLDPTPVLDMDSQLSTIPDAKQDLSISEPQYAQGASTVLQLPQEMRNDGGSMCGDGSGAATSVTQRSESEASDTLLADKSLGLSQESYNELNGTFNDDNRYIQDTSYGGSL